MVYRGQIFVNLSTLGAAVVCAILLTFNPHWTWLFPILLVLGVFVALGAWVARRLGLIGRRRGADVPLPG